MPSLPRADPARPRRGSRPGSRYLLRFDRVQLRSACRQPLHFKPVRMGLLQHSYRLAIGAQLGQPSRTRPGSQGLHPSCLQCETAARATPSRRATSRIPLPCRNNLAPIIRRISSASAPAFVLMVQNTSTHRYHHNTSANNRPNGWSQSCEAARSSLPAAAEEIVRQGKSIRHEELWQALEWPSG